MFSRPLDANPDTFVHAGVAARQHVYALDAMTGATLWDTALAVRGTVPTYNESAVPMYADGLVYDGSGLAPYVTALDARTGKVRWTLRVSGPVKGGFVTRDGVLYFGDLSGRLWAVDALSGRVLGSVQTDLKFNVGSPILLNGSLVIGSAGGPVIAIPLGAIRASRAVSGVTSDRPSLWRWMIAIAFLIAAALAARLTWGRLAVRVRR